MNHKDSNKERGWYAAICHWHQSFWNDEDLSSTSQMTMVESQRSTEGRRHGRNPQSEPKPPVQPQKEHTKFSANKSKEQIIVDGTGISEGLMLDQSRIYGSHVTRRNSAKIRMIFVEKKSNRNIINQPSRASSSINGWMNVNLTGVHIHCQDLILMGNFQQIQNRFGRRPKVLKDGSVIRLIFGPKKPGTLTQMPRFKRLKARPKGFEDSCGQWVIRRPRWKG